VERLPWGVVVIDQYFDVHYMNHRFQEIFDPPKPRQLPMDQGKKNICMGHILGCKYNGSSDNLQGMGACRHCEFSFPVDTLLGRDPKDHGSEDKYTVVKEFRINGENVLKYLEIQRIVLGGHRVMLLVEDCTGAALEKLNAMENSSVQR